MKQAGVIYKIDGMNCNKSYIGETLRPLQERLKEHQTETEDPENSEAKYTRQAKKESEEKGFNSAIAEHAKTQNHIMNWESTKIIAKEGDWRLRGIKEAIEISTGTYHHRNHLNIVFYKLNVCDRNHLDIQVGSKI